VEQDEARVGRICEALSARGVITRVDLESPRDCAAWAACDLANMVEGCFHRQVDPSTIDTRHWLARLGKSYSTPRFADDDWLTRWYWLGTNGGRLGTIALPVSPFGRRRVPLYSLFVVPALRGRSIATDALRALYECAIEEGFNGVQLETHWAWQRSLKFYLDRKMWVINWKHSITLGWDRAWPAWECEGDERELVFLVGGDRRLTARRNGDRLVLVEHGGDEGIMAYARTTFAVVLAMRGWPMVRSQQQWRDRWQSSDMGEIEGLAAKIQAFERMHELDGWDLRTPRLLGLPHEEEPL
jgi:GNAT superfamily N-acetyltransferase